MATPKITGKEATTMVLTVFIFFSFKVLAFRSFGAIGYKVAGLCSHIKTHRKK